METNPCEKKTLLQGEGGHSTAVCEREKKKRWEASVPCCTVAEFMKPNVWLEIEVDSEF